MLILILQFSEGEIRKAYETKKTHLRHTVPFSVFLWVFILDIKIINLSNS
jgi:hypothetical protein